MDATPSASKVADPIADVASEVVDPIADAAGNGRQFRTPVKRLGSREDLDAFLASSCCGLFMSFVERLNSAVIGVPISPDRHSKSSKVVVSILSLLDALLMWIDEIPSQDNHQSRFGNPAFRVFYDRLAANRAQLLAPIVPHLADAIDEVGVYLLESFGNRQRIDYGTGHEANFIAFLLCLDQLGVVTRDDDLDLVLSVFARYMDVMRQLQRKYWLEPAGSHGVWGLDDYHFLPFLFGSAQLVGHRFCRPRAIRSDEIVTQLSPQYLYFACIQFIKSVKTVASLRWHSPMLDDISAVKTWDKVNAGMLKMYRGEVLAKLPIMQHFLFGTLIAFGGGTERPADHDSTCCGVRPSEFPTCCGIPVPSAMSLTSSMRPLPFD